LELVLEVQQEEARPYEDDGRPNLIEITCVYCGGCCRIYARASDNERTYARACQAVKLWVMCHKHCLPMRRIPGLVLPELDSRALAHAKEREAITEERR